MSYQGQMLHSDGFPLGPAHLLYLATRAGALALGLDEVGDLNVGKQADFMLVRPPCREHPGRRIGAEPFGRGEFRRTFYAGERRVGT